MRRVWDPAGRWGQGRREEVSLGVPWGGRGESGQEPPPRPGSQALGRLGCCSTCCGPSVSL